MADDERDPSKGIWLDENKPLDHYLLRSGATLFYQDVRRILVVKMLDQSKKSVEVNDAQTVSQMMETICKKLGITNFDEYSLAREISKEQVRFQQERAGQVQIDKASYIRGDDIFYRQSNRSSRNFPVVLVN